MTGYREINAIAKDPPHARRLAQYLLKLKDIEWTDWELDFLENLSAIKGDLSTRQAEKIVQLRDASVWYEKVEGFSLRLLINSCSLMQHLLSVHDEKFIQRLKASGTAKLRRRDAARLLRCARTTGEIEPYQGWTLEPPKLDAAA